MPVEDETDKNPFHDLCVCLNRTGDDPPLSLLFHNLGPGRKDFSRPDGSEKPHIGRAEDDIRVVDRQHCRIIGQTEGEAPMDQPQVVGGHFRGGLQTRLGAPGLK